MITLKKTAVAEVNAMAIEPGEVDHNNLIPYEATRVLRGTWYRVFPSNGEDVAFLQWLEHHTDKFAPAKGDGIFISQQAFDRLSQSNPTRS